MYTWLPENAAQGAMEGAFQRIVAANWSASERVRLTVEFDGMWHRLFGSELAAKLAPYTMLKPFHGRLR